jgi:hypothetical protein
MSTGFLCVVWPEQKYIQVASAKNGYREQQSARKGYGMTKKKYHR